MRNWLVGIGFAAAVLVMSLGSSQVPLALAQAAPDAPPGALPPDASYMLADDKLVKARYAENYASDSDDIKKGRFYDAGWTLNTAGEAVPGEWRMRVTHIKFDYKDNVTKAGSTDYSEGFTLMKGPNDPLSHVKPPENKTKGEWVYRHILNEPAAGRSEPALYVASRQVKIKARIECAKRIHAAEIGAKEIRWNNADGSPVDRNWLDLERQDGKGKKTMVYFAPVTAGDDTLFVSRGDDGSEYVEFTLMGATKDSIDRSDIVWQWYANNMMTDGMSPPKNAAALWGAGTEGWQINKSGRYEDIMMDELPVEVVKPHHFYTVLDVPKAPWNELDVLGSHQYPWVTALDFAIVDRIKLRGTQTLAKAAEAIATYAYQRGTYDHELGRFWFLDNYDHGLAGMFRPNLHLDFLLSVYISGGSKVNCHDQAMALATFASLMGGAARYMVMEPFGYVKPANFCGGINAGDNCNNPFHEMSGDFMEIVNAPLVDNADTMWRLDTFGKRKRSQFANHGWMDVEGNIYDATAGDVRFSSGGAVLEDSDPRIFANLVEYMAKVIDLSVTETAAWEDNLEVAARANFDPNTNTWTLVGPALKDPNGNKPDPKYKNGDAAQVAAKPFTLR